MYLLLEAGGKDEHQRKEYGDAGDDDAEDSLVADHAAAGEQHHDGRGEECQPGAAHGLAVDGIARGGHVARDTLADRLGSQRGVVIYI